MSLRIVKSSEVITVDRVNVCIYAPPGVGKTHLAFTAEAPLLLDADEGSYRAVNRKDTVPVKVWQDIAGIEKEDLDPYKTVIVDTAGRALDKLTADIISNNPKMGRGGALTLQGYGELKAKFTAWMKMVNTFGKDVVLLCHMDEQRRGDDVIDRIDVQGGSKGEIYKSVDAMGKLYMDGKNRILDFSPRENAYGKNPAQFDVLKVPMPMADDYLAALIRDIKEKINLFSQTQKAAVDELDEWRVAVNDLKTVEEFNLMIPGVIKAGPAVKMLLHIGATKLGYVFNKTAGAYEPAKVA